MYISLLVHSIEQSTFFLSSAVLPHPTSSAFSYIRQTDLSTINPIGGLTPI
jgi:hypothetical protein